MLDLRAHVRLVLGSLALLLLPTVAHAAPAPGGEDPVLYALDQELARSFSLLEVERSAPFFIGLEAVEIERVSIQGEEGGLQGYSPKRTRWIHADVRIGDPKLDSSHPLRNGEWEGRRSGRRVTTGEDVSALRHDIWKEIDGTFRKARKRYERVQADRMVLVEEEQTSWDLAPVKPSQELHDRPTLSDLDLQQLEESIREASRVFTMSKKTLDPTVSLTAEAVTQWFVSSDGHRIRHGSRRFRLSVHADTIADDGAELSMSHIVDTASPDRLPSTKELVAAARTLDVDLAALRAAPREEPYSGPALLSGRAAAVFFHEIFGHRVEGHRLKEVSDSQTFRNQVGHAILPNFLSVHDDPTLTRVAGVDLRGSYRFDNQGTPAERVTLVKDGILKGFLESRSPVESTGRSNAHGRRQPGKEAVTRQGNLIVSAARTFPESRLRGELRQMAREAGLEYALYIEDINGGFTFTDRTIPNAFNVTVNVARRVFADGRPDQLVRGVDLIGTPLQTFSKIVAGSDRVEVFNGSCGAESGWVPVSAASPALLVSQVETQRKALAQARPPLLPPPDIAPEAIGDDVLLSVLTENTERAARELTMPDAPGPGWVEMKAWDIETHRTAAFFGVNGHPTTVRSRPVEVEVIVGDHALNSSRVRDRNLPSATAHASLVVEDSVPALSRDLWGATDTSYKAALKRYAFKKGARKNSRANPPPDLVAVGPVTHIDTAPFEAIPHAALEALVAKVSSRLRGLGLVQGWTAAKTISGRRYVVRSDGTRIREPHRYTAIYSYASAARQDGLRVEDHRQWVVKRLEDLPTVEEMAAETGAMGKALQARLKAGKVSFYQGPVVFEGAAAAQLFAQLLPASLEGTPPSPRPGTSFEQLTRKGPRLKRRVLPTGWRVVDDPSTAGFAAQYQYDDDGVRAEPVELVRNGLVVDLLMSRVPRRDIRRSNGHARGDAARLSAWAVKASKGLSDRAFNRRVDRLRKSSELGRVLVVRRLDMDEAGKLVAPTDAVWRYPHGGEEPVLALEFQGVDRRTLYNIAAAGRGTQRLSYLDAKTPSGYRSTTSGLPMEVTAPDKVVVTDLELIYPGPNSEPLVIPPPPMAALTGD